MRLALINTGGTISCVGKPLAPMTATEFAQAGKRLLDPIFDQQYPDLTVDYLTDLVFPGTGLGTLDSTDLQPLDWCVIAERILTDYQKYDGWIVLHGTDSMAHSASALPFLLNAVDRNGVPTASLSKPVVLTGSQSPLFSQDRDDQPLSLRFSTDAYQNLCAAITFAQQGIPEVTVAFRGDLWRGNRVLKMNADRDDAFSSPNFPPLAKEGIGIDVNNSVLQPGPATPEVSADDPRVQARLLDRLHHIAARINQTVVFPLRAFPAAFGNSNTETNATLARILDAVISTGIQGLILESYGAGNFPSAASSAVETGPVQQVIAKAVSTGIIVVNCTQVLSGTVDSSIYAAGAWLAQAGAISAGDMTPICAFSKATILLAEQGWEGNDWEEGTVTDMLRKSLLGEREVIDQVDVLTGPVVRVGQSISALDGSATLAVGPGNRIILLDAAARQEWSMPLPANVLSPVTLHLKESGVYVADRSGRSTCVFATPKGKEARWLTLRGSYALQNLELVVLSSTGESLGILYSQ